MGFHKIKHPDTHMYTNKNTHTPAGELLHGDSFLDEVLGLRVDERQSWVLRALVLDCHLVGETNQMCESCCLHIIFLI